MLLSCFVSRSSSILPTLGRIISFCYKKIKVLLVSSFVIYNSKQKESLVVELLNKQFTREIKTCERNTGKEGEERKTLCLSTRKIGPGELAMRPVKIFSACCATKLFVDKHFCFRNKFQYKPNQFLKNKDLEICFPESLTTKNTRWASMMKIGTIQTISDHWEVALPVVWIWLSDENPELDYTLGFLLPESYSKRNTLARETLQVLDNHMIVASCRTEKLMN